MARKYVIEQTKDNVFHVAGYIRLSLIKSDETNTSIESRKLIIENFLKERSDMILEKFYIDENISGSTFKRDAFEEMIQDIENGKINCIVCKDLSRFSRNLLGTGYYIEKYFPQHEVGFIAINNEFDTINDIYESDEQGNLKKDFCIQSMLDEAVAHEISPKEYRELVDALTDNLESIAKLEGLIAEKDKLRERYNLYVKVSGGKIDMSRFTDNFLNKAIIKVTL